MNMCIQGRRLADWAVTGRRHVQWVSRLSLHGYDFAFFWWLLLCFIMIYRPQSISRENCKTEQCVLWVQVVFTGNNSMRYSNALLIGLQFLSTALQMATKRRNTGYKVHGHDSTKVHYDVKLCRASTIDKSTDAASSVLMGRAMTTKADNGHNGTMPGLRNSQIPLLLSFEGYGNYRYTSVLYDPG